MLKINKSFIRKITIGNTSYMVEQFKETQVITITTKKGGIKIYEYNSKENVAVYDERQLGLIELVLSTANIDRYIL
jgi:predicted GTPase